MIELQNYPAVKNWLGRMTATSQESNLSYFTNFMKWMKEEGGKFSDYTPDQLIEYQKKADDESRYDILDLAQNYITQSKGRVNTKKTRYFNIRSFFLHNRTELPRDPSYNIRSKVPPVQGTLSADEIKKVIMSCNPAYQAAYLVMFQAALDHQMFIYWNMNGYDSLIKQLRGDPDVVKIDLPGRKKNRNEKPYYSFIGRDAVETLKNWFQLRPENAKGIITNQFGESLRSYDLKNYWLSHLRKTGIVEQEKGRPRVDRTGKNLHEMRDVYRSLWSKSPASHIVCEFTMGHSIDPLGYDKSFRDVEFYQSEYLKASPYLNIMSRGEAFGQVDKGEVDLLRKELNEAKRGQGDVVQHLEAELRAFRENQQEFIRQEIEKMLLLAQNKQS